MADETYNIGVRKALNEMGVGDERIGFDSNTGYVSVDGKQIIKPQANIDGSTYTDQASLNSIRGNVNQLNNAYNVQQKVLNPQPTTNPYDSKYQSTLDQINQRINQPIVNPYSNQIDDLIQQISNRVNNPAQIDRNSIYQSADYAAQQAQAQRQAGQATRSGQEALGTSGMARSSDLARLAQNAQNDANQYLETQVVPALIAQEQAKQQQQLGNLMALLNPLQSQQANYLNEQRGATNDLLGLLGAYGQQQGLFDSRENNQFDRSARVLDFLTGQQNRAEDVAYRNDRSAVEDQRYNDTISYRNERDAIGDQRYADETAYGREQDALAQRNLEDEKAYRRERAGVEDQRWWADYQRQGQQFAASQGLQWANLSQRQQEFIADQAYKQKALDAQNDPNNLDNRYKAEQLKKLQLDNANNTPTNIDEYDLIAVEQLASQSGINLRNPKAADVKNFVATQKAKNGWSVDEAKSVESYLLGGIAGTGGSSANNSPIQPFVPQPLEDFGRAVDSGIGNAANGFGEWWLNSVIGGGNGIPGGNPWR